MPFMLIPFRSAAGQANGLRLDVDSDRYSDQNDGIRGGVMKFRKKPVVIEAYKWSGAAFDDIVLSWEHWDVMNSDEKCKQCGYELRVHGRIPTLEVEHNVCLGDWIITGVKGEHYACKPDIFEATYEPVAESVLKEGL